MIVAGLGFRATACLADLQEALRLTGGAPDALASLTEKTESLTLRRLAQSLSLPLIALAPESIRGEPTLSSSPRIQARFGTGSLAEAAALVGARQNAPGAGARLLGPRRQTANGMATAALAERISP